MNVALHARTCKACFSEVPEIPKDVAGNTYHHVRITAFSTNVGWLLNCPGQ
jgi:hypothetical protein